MKPDVITPTALAARMKGHQPPVLLDVREPEELDIAMMPDALHLPLTDLVGSLGSLDQGAEYVVVCHHGVRSAQAATWMLQRGFTRVLNLLGGIDAWAVDVDSSIPRY